VATEPPKRPVGRESFLATEREAEASLAPIHVRMALFPSPSS
jgi:hypothetical protein